MSITSVDLRVRARERLVTASAPLNASLPIRNTSTVLGRGDAIPSPGDDDLNPGALSVFDWSSNETNKIAPKPAAVLVGILDNDALDVYFTQRTSVLPTHAGQISFPGGKIDFDDPGPTEAALREAQEEIGLTSRHVEPLGFLETYRTGTGYSIQPLVALIDPEFVPEPNPSEVAELFTVPLDYLMDENRMDIHDRVIDGRDRRFYAVNYNDRFIWGATAGILRNMRERLFG
ncbi:MAG: CoA pyrophosphatase [Pseudomonadota bacterium]